MLRFMQKDIPVKVVYYFLNSYHSYLLGIDDCKLNFSESNCNSELKFKFFIRIFSEDNTVIDQ